MSLPFIDQLLLTVSGVVAPPPTGKSLYLWGSNTTGQIGDSKGYNLYSWQQLSAGGAHTLGLRSDGFIFAWGNNSLGQLGDSTTSNRSSPVQVGTQRYSYITAGGSHSVAIAYDGTIYGWGLNSSGQIGGQSLAPRSAPTQLYANYTSFSNVSAGKNHTMAVDVDGSLWAWGDNTYGQLGDESTVSRSQPVQISFKENSTQFYPPLTTTTQYSSLTTPFSSNFDVGSGDFTIEFYIWVQSNPVISTTGTSYVFYIVDNTSAANNWGVYQGSPSTASTVWTLTGSLLPGVNFPTNGYFSLASTYNIYGAWMHHALVRSSGTFYWYVNGTLAGSTTTARVTPLTLGPAQVRLGTGLNALISNFRLIKGTAQYTTAFDPPSTPLSSVTNTTLLTFQSGQFNDNSPNNVVLTPYGNPTTTGYPLSVSSKNPFPGYPSYSTYFDGSGDYAIIGSNALTLLSLKSYTIEFYVRPSALPGSGKMPIIGQWSDTTANAAWLISLTSSGNVEFYFGPNSTSTALMSSSSTLSTNTWYHIAITRNNGTWTMYIDGTSVDTETYTGFQTVSVPSQSVTVGNYYNISGTIGGTGTTDFNGYITNLRIVSSTVVYTGNFTKPSAPFNLATGPGTNKVAAAASNVLLLTFQNKTLVDNSNYSPLPVTSQGTLTPSLTTSPYSLTYQLYSGVTAGESHTFVIDTNNKLWAFGNNDFGQLGDNTIVSKSSPIQIGTGSWSQVAAGGTHSAAINSSGSLYTWGYNLYGQLGNNSSVSAPTVWSKIHDGFNHFVGIKTDGTLWAWGFNWYGQLGDGTTLSRSSPVQVGSDTNWSSVSGGGSHTVATKTDGSMYVWGANNYGQLGRNEFPLTPISWSSPFNNVYPAPSSVVTVKSDGTLWAWGDNASGQLGDSTVVAKSSPIQIGNNSNWSIAGTAQATSYGITKDGLLYTWGLGTSGQLGDNTATSKSSPVLVATNVSTAVIGNTFMFYFDNLGHMYATGSNGNYQFGILDSTNRSSPVLVGPTSQWSKVVPVNAGALALKQDGTLWVWGYPYAYGQLGTGDTLSRSSPVQLGTSSYVALAAGEYNAYAIRSDYTLWAWGYNLTNGVGDGTTVSRSSPVQITTSGVTSWVNVIAGQSHAMALTSDYRLFAWGTNTNGQLGLGDTLNRPTPVQVPGSWTNIYATFQGTFATQATTNILYGWGLNSSGQLGLGNTIARSSPVQVLAAGTNMSSPVQINTWASWTQVAAGGYHTLALATTGTLYGWGLNFTGQVGNTTGVIGTSWKKIVAGTSHVVAIRSNNTLWTWGGNSNGQIGDSTTVNRSSPVQVGGIRQYTDADVGFASTYAIDNTGLLYAWGLNNAGQLGLQNTIARSSPVQVESGTSNSNTVYSTYFNSGTDYLTISNNAALQLGTADYTIEFWINPTNFTAQAVWLDFRTSNGATGGAIQIYATTGGIVTVYGGSGTVTLLVTAGSAISATTWTHIALTRASNSTKLFINGIQSGSTATDSTSYGLGALWIGTIASSGNSYLIGYMSNLRVVKGQALYTTTFTPSTSPLTTTSQGISTGTVSLLTLQSKTFIDNSSNNLTLTATGSPYTTVLQVPFAQSYTYTSWSQISGGQSNALAIDASGYLYTWGLNSSGQLGQSDTVARSSPVQVGLATNWTQVQGGGSHSAAINSLGRLYTWGANNNGQLGQGDTVNRSALTQLGTSSWTMVNTTGDHIAGIDTSGKLYTWGLNSAGQLGDGATFARSAPVQLAYGTATSSSVFSTIHNGVATNYITANLNKAFDPSIGDWTIEAWVYTNALGSHCLISSNENTTAPRFYIQWSTTTIFVGDNASNPINTSYVIPALQWNHIAVVRNSGTMYFYVGGVSRASTASSLASNDWMSLLIGVKGQNGAYRLDGFISNLRIVVGTALYPSGTTFTPATSNLTTTSQGATASQVYLLTCQSSTFVDNSTYNNTITTAGVMSTTPMYVPFTQSLTYYSWTNVNAAYSHTVATTSTGTLWSWGFNTNGQLGDGTTVSRSSPIQLTATGGTSFTLINGGGGLLTAFDAYGGAQLFGNGVNGEMGDATTVSRSSPVQISALPETQFNYPVRITTSNSWAQISAGYTHSMAIRLDGGLFTWGNNAQGQLGDGTTVDKSSPVQLGTNSWISMAAGNLNSAAIKNDYTLYTWGLNTSGQVGDSTTVSRSSPVQVAGTWTDIEVGSSTLYGISLSKKVYGWGYNVQGQIGDYTILYRSTPVQISNSNFNYVSAQGDAGSAIDMYGNIYSWGRNQYGQLGNNTTPYLSWVMLNNGDLHSLALRNDGTLWAWGANNVGQLGDGTVVPKSSPVQISGSWVDVSAGYSTSAGIKSDGTLYTWGTNLGGQLGLGYTMARSSPTQIESGVGNSNTVYSVAFNGTSDYLVTATNPGFILPTTTTPFTVEAWVYLNSGNGVIFTTSSASIITIALVLSASGVATGATDGLYPTIGYYSSSTWTHGAGSSSPMPLRTWVHVAAVFTGSTTKIYMNGVDTTSSTAPATTWLSDTTSLTYIIGRRWDTSSNPYLNGYISNLRWVRGVAVYTGNFTVPTSKLTAVQSSSTNISAILPGQTVLLTCQNGTFIDNSNNNTTITASGSTFITTTQVPFTQSYTYNSWSEVSVGFSFMTGILSTGALYAWGLNSTYQLGDGTTFSRSSPTQIGSSSWVNVSSFSNSLIIGSDNKLYGLGTANAGNLGIPTTISWTKIVASRGGSYSLGIRSDGRLFAWGLNTSGQLGDNSTASRSSPIQIGTASYIDVAAATTATLAIKNDYTLWAWGTDTNGLLGTQTTVARSSPVQIQAQGGSTVYSGSYTGSATDYVSATNASLFAFGTGDFTIECWVYLNSTATQGFIYDSRPASTNGTYVTWFVTTGAILTLYVSTANRITSPALALNRWYHVALSRVSGTTTMYINGMPTGSPYTDATSYTDTTPIIGASYNASASIAAPLNGYISNLRVVKGVGVYTGPFAPPTSNLSATQSSGTNISAISAGQCSLLTLQNSTFIDNSGNNLTMTAGTTARTTYYTVPFTQSYGTTSWTKVDAGSSHAMAIKSDGKLYTWGLNANGQLGDTTTLSRSSPVQIASPRSFALISAGNSFSYATDSTGSFFTWGDNTGGQLGVPQPLWTYAGSGLRIATNGTLWGVGNNANGQIGDNTVIYRSTPVQIGYDQTWSKTYNTSEYSTSAIKTDGTLWVWGNNQYGQLGQGDTIARSSPVQVPGSWVIAAVVAVTTFGIKTDGTLWAWGYNAGGQVPDGTTVNKSSPVQIGTDTWLDFHHGYSNGNHHAIKSDGTLWGWGQNNNGQLGDGTTVDKSSPVQVSGGGSWISVTSGGLASMGIKSNGQLYTWGNNTIYGLLGNGSTAGQRSSPVQVTSTNSFSFVTSNVNTAWALTNTGLIFGWGGATGGILGDGTIVAKSSPVQVGTGSTFLRLLVQQSLTGQQAIAIKNDNTIYGWGNNIDGELGDGTTVSKSAATLVASAYTKLSAPNQVGTSSWNAISAGGDAGYGIIGTTLYGWGLNAIGQVGDGTTINRSSPVQIGTSFAIVVAGYTSNAMAVKTDNTIWMWGNNTANGYLGIGDTLARYAPTQISPLTVTRSVSWTTGYKGMMPGLSTVYAIGADSRLYVWGGNNANGVYGDGTTVGARSSPVQLGTDYDTIFPAPTLIDASSWSQISVGSSHSAAIKSDGKLYTWGLNSSGQLGQNVSFTSITAGMSLSFFIRSDGQLWGTGANSAAYPALGDNSTVNRSSPAQVGASTGFIGDNVLSWTQVSAGFINNYAIRKDGALFAWGNNQYGLVGDSTTVAKSSPLQLGTSSWSMVKVGTAATGGSPATAYAIRSDGAMFVWGDGTLGQYGDGNLYIAALTRSSPVQMGTSSWTFVAAGAQQAFAIKPDGTLWGWGNNLYGILKATPTAYSWTSIAAGSSHTIAVRNDGKLFAWGYNLLGQLGDTTTNSRSSPVQIGLGYSWITTAARGSSSYATRNDGTLWSWGSNAGGELGIGWNFNVSSPTQVMSGSATGSTLYSYFFDTANMYLSNASVPNLAIGAGDFTAESWVYLTQFLSANYQIFHYYSAAGNQYGMYVNGATGGFEVNINGTAITYTPSAAVYMTSFVWYHIAVTRASGIVKLFINGLEQTRVVNTGSVTTAALYVGAVNTPASYFKGYINNLRIVVGTSLYNTNFIPPSSNLTAVTGTQLLTCQSSTIVDNSANNITFTNTLTVTSSYLRVPTPFTQVLNYTSWTQIAAGVSFATAVTSTGQLFAWGANATYQLGDGTTLARSSPVQVAVGSSFTQVSAFSNAMAIDINSKLYGWGPNASGVLGIQPISWTKVALMSQMVAAIRSDGTLWMWGSNNNGNLGQGDLVSRSSPIQVGTATYTDVAVTNFTYSVAAIRSDGTLWAWGDNTYGQLAQSDVIARSSPVQITAVAGSWTQIEGGAYTFWGLQTNGKLWGWGNGTDGTLAEITTTVSRSSPVQIATGKSFTFISGSPGTNRLLAKEVSTGYLWTWGSNTNGALGDGTTASRSSPVQIGSSSWTLVISGQYGGYGIIGTTLFAWGDNVSGWLGDGTTSARSSPVQIGTDYALVASTGSATAAVKTDGSLWSWGNNAAGQLGNGTIVSRSNPTQILSFNALRGITFKQTYKTLFGTNQSAFAAIGVDNRLYMWGAAGTGGIFADNTINGLRSSPVQIGSATLGFDADLTERYPTLIDNSKSWSQISVGDSHAAAIDTTGRLYTWGVNTAGQLGVTASFVQIQAGFQVSHIIRSDYSLWGWGSNNNGQIGDASALNRSSPVQINANNTAPSGFVNDPILSWTSVFTGSGRNTAAIRGDGRLFVWGPNYPGDNTTVTKSFPVTAAAGTVFFNNSTIYGFSSFTQVATVWQTAYGVALSYYNTGFAIKNDGTLWAWGDNQYGQLGQGTQGEPLFSSPVQISADSWSYITTGKGVPSIYGLKTDSTLWVWGNNTYGQLGVSTSFSWAKIDSGPSHTLAIRSDSKLFGWGGNANGQLGIPDAVTRSSPVQIASGSWTEVAAGASTSAAIRSDGSLWMWGAGTNGELGTGDTATRDRPTPINATVTTYSGFFNLASSYITIPANAVFAFGTNDFTIEFWINANAATGAAVILGNATDFLINWNSGGLYFQFGATTTDKIQVNTSLSNRAWYHVAITRQSTVATIWINGVANNTFKTTTSLANANPIQIGGNVAGSTYFGGWLSNLRITTGQALFTGTFTPSTSPLTKTTVGATGSGAAASLTGTVQLLTLQSKVISTDNSNNNFTLTNSLVTYQIYEVPFTQTITPETGWAKVSIAKYGLATTGEQYTLGLKTDGTLWSWGSNINGALGDVTLATVFRSSPVQVGTSSWSSISAGSSHAIGIANNSLYGWGRNGDGQLGIQSSSLMTVSESRDTITATHYIDSAGRLWGFSPDPSTQPSNPPNAYGIIGDGNTVSRSSPVQVGTDTDWKYIYSNANNTYTSSPVLLSAGIKTDARLYMWGLNTAGQLGDGTTISRSSPVQIPGSWSTVALGESYTVALRTDGTLWAWGQNTTWGNLGDGTVISKSSPVQVAGSWVSIAAAAQTTYGIRTDNTLWSWGYNGDGNLGNSTNNTVHRSSPVQITGTWSYIAAANRVAWAIRTTAGVGNGYGWGWNVSGQIGDSTTAYRSSPVQVTTTISWLSITGSYTGIHGIANGNTLYGWGDSVQGQVGDGLFGYRSAPVQLDSTGVNQLSGNVLSVQHGPRNVVALARAGTTGYNRRYGWGQGLGDNTTINKSVPTIISSAFQTVFTSPVLIDSTQSWSSVSTGQTHTTGITSTGQLYAWGSNNNGQVGIPTMSPVQIAIGGRTGAYLRSDGQMFGWGAEGTLFTDRIVRSSPTQIGSQTNIPGLTSTYLGTGYYWKKIAMGTGTGAGGAPAFMAIRNDGILFGWGTNDTGKIGDGTTANRSSPVQIGTNTWIDVVAGFNHTLAIRSDGTLWAWGGNSVGQLGQGDVSPRSSPVQVGSNTDWSKIQAGNSSSMGTTSGALYTWGYNGFGQLGLGDTTNRSTPVSTTSSFVIVSTTNNSVLAIKSDFTLWGWGQNGGNQIGTGAPNDRSTPVQVASGTSWIAVSAGAGHSLALASNGNLYGTGGNDFGQLGDNTIASKTVFTLISSSTWSMVNAGSSASVAYKADGGIYAWGVNTEGTVGDNTTVSRSAPTQVIVQSGTISFYAPKQIGTSSWSTVSAGANFTLATLTTGALFTWGLATTGQLGSTSTVSRSSPVQVGLLSYNVVSAGGSHAMAHQSTNGQLYAWGLDSFGQLGDGATVNQSSPVTVGSTRGTIEASPVQIPGSWTNVQAFGYTTTNTINNANALFLKIDGTLWSTGYNVNGAVGDGTTISRSSPVQIGTSSWSLISAGNNFAAAVRQDSTLWTWGQNTTYNLGDGTSVNRSSPVQIGLPAPKAYSTAFSISQLSAGYDHMIALTNDGSLFAWGGNSVGQLGLNDVVTRSYPALVSLATLAARSSPVQVGTNSWTNVSAGISFTGGVQTDNNLYTWGLNTTGQLGLGTTISRSNPVQLPLGTTNVNTKYNYLFNGTAGNYLAVTGNNTNTTNFIIGTGDFTIEIWHYAFTGSPYSVLYDGRPAATNGVYPCLIYGLTTANTYQWYVSSAAQIITPAIFIPGSWYHIAVVRISGVTRMYVNGTLAGNSYTDANSYLSRTNPIIGGDNTATPASIVNGYLQDLRIVKGIGVYTGNFIPPSTSLATTQSSGTNIAAISSNTSYSNAFDGTGDYLTIADNTNLRMTGDFTVEAWVYRVTNVVQTVIALNSTTATGGYASLRIDIDAASKVFMLLSNTGTSWQVNTGSSGTISLFTWTHIAVVRSGSAITLYLNGASNATGTLAGSLYAGTTHLIGAVNSAGIIQAITANISNLRYANIAVYTGTFTVPTSPLSKTQSSGTNIAALTGTETQLLTAQNSTIIDNSNNALGISVNGNVAPTKFNPFNTGATILLTAQSSSTTVDNSGDSVTITQTGTVTAYSGINAYSQNLSNTPTKVSVGYTHMVAAGSTTLAAWGFNGNGILGDNTTVNKSSPVQLGTMTIEAAPVQISGSWTTISVTTNTTAVTQYPVVAGIKTDGSLWTWGYNTDGAVGDGTVISRSSPVQLPMGAGNASTVYSVAFNGSTDYLTVPGTGSQFAFGTGNFTIECWFFGTTFASTPILFSINASWSLRLSTTGFVTWYIGGANPATVSIPVTINTWNHVAAVRTGVDQFFIYVNGVAGFIGSRSDNLTSTNTLYIGEGDTANSGFWPGYISNARIVKGQALYTSNFTPSTTPLTTTSQGATASNVGLLTCQSSTIIDNSLNSLVIARVSNPVATSITVPFTQSLNYYSWTSVSAGYDFVVASRTDGTLWAWGVNTSSQLGDGTVVAKSSPILVRTQVNASSSIQFVTAGYDHALAVATDGTLYAWGTNSYGQYGNNSGTTSTSAVMVTVLTVPSRSSPIQVGTSSWSQISSGQDYTTAITTSNRLFVWGINTVGLQGTVFTVNTSSPVQINTSGSVLLTSAGYTHRTWLSALNSYVILGSGLNTSGQLGDITAVTKSQPVPVSSLTYDNAASSPVQIGSSASVNYGTSSPSQIGSSTWTYVKAGQNHTMGLLSDSTLWAWGQNNYGQVGDSTTINRSSPVQVSTTGTIVDIEAGATHNVIEMSDGTGFAFGNNNSGQLGDGS